jgi:hypothetical protein
MNQLTKYERNAIAEIHAWKNPNLGWFGYAMSAINWPLDKAGDALFATPGVGVVIRKSIEGLTGVLNDAAQWSVRPDAIYGKYRHAGHQIRDAEDIHTLGLDEVDPVIGWLAAKYKGAALVEGAATGAAGLFGIPPNVIALLTLNLRAIGEYATYCGFDISRQEERLFAMNVLGLASSPTDASKALAMAQLVRIAQDVAKKRTWKQLEQHALVKVIQQISKALGIRLTKAKLAQVVPAAGALVGGGFDAYYTSKVCDACYFLYRERLLAVKHGSDIIEITVDPAKTVDPGYPEEDEELPDEGS